jgi:gliding motility-associated-like protein
VNTANATPSSTTTYTVTGTVLGCSSTATATVTINSALTVNAGPDDTICFGQSTPLLVTPNGGGYTYSWSPAAGLSSTSIFNPSANPTTTTTYVVVVTDVNGCTGNDNVTIYSDPQLVPVVSGTNITCNGACNGSATVATTGGSNSYTYLWSSSATTATSGSLCPGSYSVTVTDSWGCTATGSTAITQPTLLTASIAGSTQVACNGACNGTATAAGAGGTPGSGYTYTWSTVPVQTSATATALCAGTYTVTVRDANNCTSTASVNITQPIALTASITTQTNASCFGTATGSLTVAGSGGTPTYQYSINAGTTYQASGTFSGLTAGSYTILVKDGNNCTVAQPVTITQPTAVTASITAQTNVSCFGGNTGSVTVAGAGGTPAYQYSLNGGALQSSGTFTPLTAATYTVTIQDGNGCTVTQSVTITQPTQVTVTATKVDATCGAANGSITATGANGTGPYTYSIGGAFQASGTFPGLAATTYTVTVKDANGCTGTATITVVDLSGLTASITSQTNVSCFGGNNGSVTVTASGSTGPYLYALGAGALGGSGTFSSLAQGTYTVTVQDGNGCTITVPVSITQPTALTGSISAQTNISCNGLSNGSVTIAGAGGVTAYTYSLDGGAFVAGATFSGLTVGPHTITIKDANGCTVNVPVTITQPTALSLSTSVTNATCTAANGSATVTASGATPSYTYLWSPGGATTATDNANTAGNYTVTVTDANGCTSTATAVIGSNPGGTAVISSSVNVSCTGANDGSATVSMGAGATPPFTYSWTPSSQTTVTATGLAPASYTVTVTDGNGCVATATTVITQPPLLGQTFTTTNVSCFGGSNGVITINPTGGTPGYTYLWTPGSYTTQTIAGLTAGTYTCVFTDANGCQKTGSVSITQPAGMNLTSTHVDATCNMSNGSATVSVTGGTGPYTYLWSDAAAQTTATATALPSNTYVVTVTDANGCTQTLPVTINNLAGPTATVFSSTNVSCFGQNDGAATVTVSGGTIPFTFLWSNGQTLPSATNLVAGSYTLTATDASGCIASTSVTITQPLLLDLAIAITNPTCAGACNGSLISNTTGGTAPFTYLWNPGGVTTPFNLNLCAGTYTLQVTDVNGCTAFKPATLVDPVAVTVSAAASNVTCSGLCNGAAVANPLSGTGPFTYLWSDINAQTTQTATGLCPGTYTVTVTDAGGCTGTTTATVTSPASMTLAITSIGNNTCFNACDGYATAGVTGGTAPYAYNWMPISTAGASVNNLCAGTYTVTVTDANGCTASNTATITQPTALTATIASTNVTCYNACDATANAVYTGGTGPYTFQWTPTFQTTPSIINLCDGVHNLTVTDANGCTANASVVITQPTILAVSTTTTASSCGNADGSACAAVTGGVPPFSYLWNDPSSQTNSCATNINAGNYIISITDANGCSVTGVANVNDITAPVVTIPASANVTCAGAANGNAQANITGGVVPYNILWTPTGQTTAFISSLSGGIYSITVTDSIGCVGTASVTINEPAPLVSGITASSPVSCFLSCNGTSTVGAGGGTTPYTYLWNDAATQSTPTATALCAGGYTVTITDANGCTSTSTTNITTPTAISVTLISTTNVSCNGGNNGTITISAAGGTPGYTYSWTPAVGSGPSVTGLSAGSYTLVVTDQNGCSVTTNYTITQPPVITLSTITNPSTCGNSNGFVSVSPAGGTPGFTYLWNDPAAQTTAIATSLPQGNYTVVVTDNNGCTASTVVTLNDLAGPTISGFTFTEPLCNGTPLGTATVLPTGGTPLYTYLWSGVGAQTTQTATALTAGVYTVTVTDNNGCSVTGSVNVTQPAPTQIIVSPTDTICVGENAIIYGAGYGGTPSYTYFWTPSTFSGGGPHVVNPTTTATYDVYLTDANGCVSPTETITLFVNPPLSVTATDATVCSGSFVTISATAGGGNGGPYTYTWSNTVTGASQSVSPPIGLSPFDYVVTVDDGCSLLASDTATVTVNPLPVSFMLANDTAGCEDFTVTFNGVSDIGTSYVWDFGDGSPTQTGEPATHTYMNSGTYNVTLTVTSALGCSSTITTPGYITVFPAPTAAFSSSPTTVTQTAPLVSFLDQSTGVINSWLWDFDYPSGIYTDTLQNPSFSYNDTGSYIVQLVVMNNFGCTDTALNTVEILPEYTFYAPNAFTPFNHDGINDIFMVQGVGINPDDFEMSIYDRWGNMIYKTDDITKGWDGRANGGKNLAQIDVYVWKVNTTDYKGDAHQYIGTVTIVK